MGIQNTERLNINRVDLMNVGLRAFPLSTGEINELVDYFGVGFRTVQRWFAPQGQQYRRCVPSFAYTGHMPIYDDEGNLVGLDPVAGWRIFQMFDANNPEGFGDGKGADGRGTSAPIQNMRLRCFMAACLGVKDGLEREAIFTGKTRTYKQPFGTLAEAVNGVNNIYTGNCDGGNYMKKAWIRMVIATGPPLGWVLTVWFNPIMPGDTSDGAEKMKP